MYGIKAYADANRNSAYFSGAVKQPKPEQRTFTEIIKNSGDSICFSNQALEILEHGKNGVSNCPQDATYDQYGNVNRQFYALQKDLSELAASAWPVNVALASQVNAIQSQVGRLQMQI